MMITASVWGGRVYESLFLSLFEFERLLFCGGVSAFFEGPNVNTVNFEAAVKGVSMLNLCSSLGLIFTNYKLEVKSV